MIQRRTKESLLVGLTGPIGAGKSVVAKVWEGLGAGIVEGDSMGRLALESDPDLRENLADCFGKDILDDAGRVIRSKLAAAAFQSKENSRLLTSLTFPSLYTLACEHIRSLRQKHCMVAFDAALIFEWQVESDFDIIVTVSSDRELLLSRVMNRLGITRREAIGRLSVQLSPAEKVKRADIVITNNGSLDLLKSEAEKVYLRLLEA